MAVNRCYLCGCKLRRGVCTECGLDNARMTRRSYRLNESTPISVKQKQVAAQKAEALKYAREYKAEQRELENLGKPLEQKTRTTKKSVSVPNRGRSATGKTPNYTAYQKTAYKKKNNPKAGNEKENGGKWRGIKILGIIYAVFALVTSCGSCITSLVDEFTLSDSEIADFERVPEDVAVYDYDISEEYHSVTRELSDSGDHYDAIFGQGFYQVGVHIPEGTYRLEVAEGEYGSVWLNDDTNSIYIGLDFGDEFSSGYMEMDDVRLYEGASLEITGEIRLNFISENAQVDALVNMWNPALEDGEIELFASDRAYTVGVDIPAGVYDVRAVDGWTSLCVLWIDDENTPYEYYYWLDSSTLENCYNNLVLVEGMHLVFEDCTLAFVPSAVMTVDDLEKSFQEYYL